MAEMEGEPQSPEHESLNQAPLKRKSDFVDTAKGEDDRTVKHHKPESPPLEDLGDDDGQVERKEEVTNQNGNVAEEKEKSILSAADKGKGKMVLVEEDSDGRKDSGDDEGGSSEDSEESNDDDDDSDFSDDPLTEVDLDNILPVRIRRRSPLKPGAYLVGDREGDDGDDDSDDDDDGEPDSGDEAEEVEEDDSENVGTSEK